MIPIEPATRNIQFDGTTLDLRAPAGQPQVIFDGLTRNPGSTSDAFANVRSIDVGVFGSNPSPDGATQAEVIAAAQTAIQTNVPGQLTTALTDQIPDLLDTELNEGTLTRIGRD